MSDGHLNRCKECFKRGSRANRRRRLDHYRAYDRARSPIRAAMGDWRQKSRRQRTRDPHKTTARRLFWLAIRRGEIVRPEACERCRRACLPDGHHEDYAKPLEVMWLCRLCHAQRHCELAAKD
jgi:hypothetical protein